MTRPTHRPPTHHPLLVLAAVLALGVTTGLGGACAFDGLRFYEVTRTPTDECDIRPQGEFCVTVEELSPPTFEIWSVERHGDEVRVFVDDEVWVAQPPGEGDEAELVVADKLEVVTAEPGPCTTETVRSLSVLATADDITGTLGDKVRLEGPEACGETPLGKRTQSRIDGVVAGAP